MRFQDYTILELALTVRDAKANPNAYDRDSREALRTACVTRLRSQTLEEFLSRFSMPTDRSLGQMAYAEVGTYAKPAGYSSGLWVGT
jgi:hypothetical protein